MLISTIFLGTMYSSNNGRNKVFIWLANTYFHQNLIASFLLIRLYNMSPQYVSDLVKSSLMYVVKVMNGTVIHLCMSRI